MSDYETDFIRGVVSGYVRETFDSGLAYLHTVYQYQKDADPLDIEFYWDEEGFGSMAKTNLREEYMDVFLDDPEHYAEKMPVVVAALRKLADDIEALSNAAHPK